MHMCGVQEVNWLTIKFRGCNDHYCEYEARFKCYIILYIYIIICINV